MTGLIFCKKRRDNSVYALLSKNGHGEGEGFLTAIVTGLVIVTNGDTHLITNTIKY